MRDKMKEKLVCLSFLFLLAVGCAPPSRNVVENYGEIYGNKYAGILSTQNKKILIVNREYRDERRISHSSTYSIMGYWCDYTGQSKFCQPRRASHDISQSLRNAALNKDNFFATHIVTEIKNICSQNNSLLPLVFDAEILEYQSGWICGHAYTISATVEILFKIYNHKNHLLYDDIIRTDLTRQSC
jgi:hypothetical protein